MNVKKHLELMLQDAIELRRPFAEVEAIRHQLAAYEKPTLEQIRAKQDAFLKVVVKA